MFSLFKKFQMFYILVYFGFFLHPSPMYSFICFCMYYCFIANHCKAPSLVKRDNNQIRKPLSDDANSGPPEEKEVIDAIYDTSDMLILQAASEQCRLKRKRKMTDFIVVNPKRKSY